MQTDFTFVLDETAENRIVYDNVTKFNSNPNLVGSRDRDH